MKLVSTLQLFWRTNHKEAGVILFHKPYEILMFSEYLAQEEQIAAEYGLSDPRLKANQKNLYITACMRVYRKAMPLALAVLDQMKTSFRKEESINQSPGPADLFRLLNNIADLCKTTPRKEVCIAFLQLAHK